MIDEAMLKEKVWTALLERKRETATEHIAEYLMENEHFYTTRDDDKSEMWIYQDGIYVPQGKTYIKEFARRILGAAQTSHLVNQVIYKIESDTFINQEEFFNQNHVNEIAVENGILNVITKELGEFDPDKIYFQKLPVKYDIDAKCPNIIQHLREVLKDPDDIIVMFESIGFCLLKEYRYEKAIMLVGDGRNGKGKTLDLIKTFLGPDNCSGVSLHQFDADQYAAGNLFNKLANISGDLDSKSLKHTGTFKNLTGRDYISANRKFASHITFVNYAKLMFACNKLPRTFDLSFAFFDRWVIFEFPYTFIPEQEFEGLHGDTSKYKLRNQEIIHQLTTPEELSGLLNASLEGLQRLFDNKGFSNAKGVDAIKSFWIRKSDSFMAFLMDMIEESENDDRIEKQTLRKEYNRYCKKHKLKQLPDKWLRDSLFEEFPVSEHQDSDTGLRYWEGIKFKEGMIDSN